MTINMRWKGGQGKGERDKGGMCGGGCEGGRLHDIIVSNNLSEDYYFFG